MTDKKIKTIKVKNEQIPVGSKDEELRTVRIKYLEKGDEVSYGSNGVHVHSFHREYLPLRDVSDYRSRHRNAEPGRKIEPGKEYALPASVAVYYLKNSKHLEEVYA